MVKKLKIIKCIFILFCIFLAVKSQPDEYNDEDIHDLNKACINCDYNNIFLGLLKKRAVEQNINKKVLQKKEKKIKKYRMGKLIKNLNSKVVLLFKNLIFSQELLKKFLHPNNKYTDCNTLCLLGQGKNECSCNKSYFVGK
jgi:hypothetical protein